MDHPSQLLIRGQNRMDEDSENSGGNRQFNGKFSISYCEVHLVSFGCEGIKAKPFASI